MELIFIVLLVITLIVAATLIIFLIDMILTVKRYKRELEQVVLNIYSADTELINKR